MPEKKPSLIMKNENRIISGLDFFDIILLIIVAFYFILLLGVVNNRGMLGWDEAGRSMGGVALLKYLAGEMSFGDVIALLGMNHYYVYQGTFLYGPLHAFSTAAASLLFGFSVHSARLPAAIFGALGVLATYSIARIMYKDRRIAFFASLFLVGSTVYFDFSTMNFSEVPIAFAISLGTYLLFRVKKMHTEVETEKKKNKIYLLSAVAGVAFGLASLTKPSAAVMVLPIGLYLLYNALGMKDNLVKESGRKKIRKKKELKSNYAGSRRSLIVIMAIPLLILGLSVISYWSYLKSIEFYPLYMNFWTGGKGFHPETEPFSLNVLLESWKPLLSMFPAFVFLLLIGGLYSKIREHSSEEAFLLSWIGAYFFTLVASGAIGPQYLLPSIPALAIIASTAMVKFIDLYNPSTIFRRQTSDKPEFKWKSIAAAILIVFIVAQVAMVPVYKSISLQSGNEIKGEAYNPLIIRTFLQEYIPSLFWINTLYYNGSSLDFYARSGLDGDEIDTYRSLEVNIVKDIQKNNYQTATVIFLSELSNYFDFWFTADDRYLTYRFVTLEPDMLPQYVSQDSAPKYLIISKENEKKLIQNINEKESKLKYSIYKIHVSNNSIQLENMNIDQIVGYT